MKFNVFIGAAIKIFSVGERWNFPFHSAALALFHLMKAF
jgi:hypothetical protein